MAGPLSNLSASPLRAILLVFALAFALLGSLEAAKKRRADRKIVELATELRDARGERDATVWKLEVEALKREKTLIVFFDALRAAEDPYEVFKKFDASNMERPEFTLARTLPEKIFDFVHRPGSSGVRFLKRYQFETLLNDFKTGGYEIEQMEWSHEAFAISENGAAESKVAFEFHVKGPSNTLYRRIIRGVANIAWGAEPVPVPDDDADDDEEEKAEEAEEEEEYRYPTESITFDSLRQLRRSGPPVFDRKVLHEGPEGGRDLLLVCVEDIDQDGASDIAFPKMNIWFRNQGSFRWDSRKIAARLDNQHPDAALFSDLDSDGSLDYLVSFYRDGLQVVKRNSKSGDFDSKPETIFKEKDGFLPQGLTVGDIDKDGAGELFFGQYLSPYRESLAPTPYYDADDAWNSYLLDEVDRGKYKNLLGKKEPNFHTKRRVLASSFLDLDGDGRLDLLTTSDYAGTDAYLNSGDGELRPAPEAFFPHENFFGSTHFFSDFNRDGLLDICALGRSSTAGLRIEAMGLSREGYERLEANRGPTAKGGRLFEGQSGGGFRVSPLSDSVSRAGWTSGGASLDFNNDGYPEIFAVNGYLTRETDTDYDSVFWRHDIYDAMEVDPKDQKQILPALGVFPFLANQENSWAGFQKDRLFMNLAGEEYINVAYLLGVASGRDNRAVVAEDFDLDGRTDLLVIEQDNPERIQYAVLYRNLHAGSEKWIGFQLPLEAKTQVSGTRIRIKTPSFETERVFTLGSGYSSQSPARLHFGLGEDPTVEWAKIFWPDGTEQLIESPDVGSYHRVEPTVP